MKMTAEERMNQLLGAKDEEDSKDAFCLEACELFLTLTANTAGGTYDALKVLIHEYDVGNISTQLGFGKRVEVLRDSLRARGVVAARSFGRAWESARERKD